MAREGTRRSSATEQKNALFCPHCGHESPTDGDWRVRPTASGAVYGCPACGADVTTRPAGEARTRRDRFPEAGESLVSGWVRLAFAWTPWPPVASFPNRRGRSPR